MEEWGGVGWSSVGMWGSGEDSGVGDGCVGVEVGWGGRIHSFKSLKSFPF